MPNITVLKQMKSQSNFTKTHTCADHFGNCSEILIVQKLQRLLLFAHNTCRDLEQNSNQVMFYQHQHQAQLPIPAHPHSAVGLSHPAAASPPPSRDLRVTLGVSAIAEGHLTGLRVQLTALLIVKGLSLGHLWAGAHTITNPSTTNSMP